jgi:cell division transport system ATP-binding protein
MNTILEFESVRFQYNNQPIVSGVSFQVGFNLPVFLIGKSGVGKSTLLKMAYLELFPASGYVRIDGLETTHFNQGKIARVRRRIGVVFQDNKLLQDRTVYDNLAFVLEVTKHPASGIRKKVGDTLSLVGLSHKAKNLPSELSGGEIQRVGIARAIINSPVLVIADEPTGNLDPDTSRDIIDIFRKIHAGGAAVLIATHNYSIIPKGDVTILNLENGMVNPMARNNLLQ